MGKLKSVLNLKMFNQLRKMYSLHQGINKHNWSKLPLTKGFDAQVS